MDNLVAKLYQTPKTVLTTKDLSLIWRETSQNNLKAKIAYYIRQGALTRLTRGVFVRDKNYNPRELATSLYTPSYISFETALREKGVIFQHYDTIFVAGPWSRSITIDATKITFRKLKDTALFSPTDIENKDAYGIASAERALLDTLYLFPDYYFDNLRSINWERCFEIVRIYHNQQLVKRLRKYQKHYAQ